MEDREKQIKELVGLLSLYTPATCKNNEVATALVNAGYGDVKQAVREFAERLKERLAQKEVIKYKGHTQEIFIDMQATVIIDKLVKEICGE